ncbi:MAG: hypothetical protein RLZZ618_2611 [Pseudomonadota bacterium]|jgi:hypothetical protein
MNTARSAKARQRELKLAYKLALPPMGVFCIRNLVNGRQFVERSMNLTGSLNRHRMELHAGVHRHRELMTDWRVHGEAQFVFEVLDQVKERPEPDFNYAQETEDLLARWQAKLPMGSAASYR